MPTGWADYTYPITVNAVSVDVLPFDIRITEVTAGVTFDVHIESVDADVTFNVSIAEVATGVTFDIRITEVAAGVTFNVNIESVGTDVTFNVHVESAETFTVNIQTSAGANIVIDKLTVGAFTDTRRVLENQGTECRYHCGLYYEHVGKFFPRGCRGFLDTIQIWFENPNIDDREAYVHVTPYVGGGDIWSGTLVVGAKTALAPHPVHPKIFWSFDSMFIWVETPTDGLCLAYDKGEPYDCYEYALEAPPWRPSPLRPWIKVWMNGQTVGDIPVSGTLTTVEVPGLTTTRQEVYLNVPPNSELYDTVQRGMGEVLIVIFSVTSDVVLSRLRPRIRIDGQQVLPFNASMGNWYAQLVSENTPGITIGRWDTTTHHYTLVVTLPLSFKETLEVGYYNADMETAYSATIGYTYRKIS